MKSIIERLRGVVIENRDYSELFEAQDTTQTLFYLDPPYVSETRDAGGDYRHEMSDEDHRALAGRVHSLKGMVVLSGYDCDLYSELYSDWRKVSVSAHADGARARTECLWLSPNAIIKTQPSFFA